MDTGLCTFHRVLGGAVILDEKERLTATYHAIMSFLVFTTWYPRSHQSPHVESPSEGVAVEGYLPRILRGGGCGPWETGSCDPLALVDDAQHLS